MPVVTVSTEASAGMAVFQSNGRRAIFGLLGRAIMAMFMLVQIAASTTPTVSLKPIIIYSVATNKPRQHN